MHEGSDEEGALSTRDLRVRIGAREILRGISVEVEHGQTLGIVGESGSGKSMTVLAATGLLDAPGAEVTGSSVLMGEAGWRLSNSWVRRGACFALSTAAGSGSCSRIRGHH